MIARARADLLAGAIFVTFGLFFSVGALVTMEVGTPAAMGPGFFPLALGVLLVVLGTLVAGEGIVGGEEKPIGGIPWNAAVLIAAALLLFGLTVRVLGLLPALFVAVLLPAFAARRTSRRVAVAIAVGLTVLSVLIFVVALRLPLQLFGTWFTF